MYFPDPIEDAAVITAGHMIIKASQDLRADLERKAQWERLMDSTPNYGAYTESQNSAPYPTLLNQFRDSCHRNLDTIENFGSESYFTQIVEWYIVAANAWNKHIFSRLRNGKGEIAADFGSNGNEIIKVTLYTWDTTQGMGTYFQSLDVFEVFESSPLRNIQSMQFALEYYQTLLEEISSSFVYVSEKQGIQDNERQIFMKEMEDLQYKIKQMEFGFETDGAAWVEHRNLSYAASLRRREEETRVLRAQEEERRQAGRFQEQQRLEAQQREEQQRLEFQRLQEQRRLEAQRREEQKRLEALRLQQEQEARDRQAREFTSAKIQNEKLRQYFRNESDPGFSTLIQYEGFKPTHPEDKKDKSLQAFAVFYDDENPWPKASKQPAPPSWPRDRSSENSSPSQGNRFLNKF